MFHVKSPSLPLQPRCIRIQHIKDAAMLPHHVALCAVAGSERPYARQGLQCPLRLWFGQPYGRSQILGIDDGLGGEMGHHAPDGGVSTHSGKELLCVCKLGFQL